MARPVTLYTLQWGDLPLETVCQKAKAFGYDGLELGLPDHVDVRREDDAYYQGIKDLLRKYGLSLFTISSHLVGQAICAALTLDQAGNDQLPIGPALVTSCLRNFTLGDCHDDTSCISEFLFFLASILVQKLGQHRQSRIHFLFTGAGPLVEINAAARANTLAIL